MLFKKKCEYCKKVIKKHGGVKARVKVPEFKAEVFRCFCGELCWGDYRENIKGTTRTNYCPSCPI